MAVRLSKLGGTDWGEEGLKPTTDLVPTLNAMIYEQKAINSIATTASLAGTASQTMTVSIPANSVSKYIEIKAFLYGSSNSTYASTNYGYGYGNVKLYKTYATVSTDLISTFTFTNASGSNNYITDVNSSTLYYYYEPTASEIANGFDISIDLNVFYNGNSAVSANITCEFINIMGI